MAHGNYECCAVCDCEIYYNENAQAKEGLCNECCLNLFKKGFEITDSTTLLSKMIENPKEMLQVLLEIGFKKCFYSNKIDEKFEELGHDNPTTP